MTKIFVRDKKRMIEVGDLAKEVAKERDIKYKLAFSYVFNEASCGGIAFVEADVGGKPVYQLATKNDFLQRLLDEKDITDGREE
jgi:hypothetical protein